MNGVREKAGRWESEVKQIVAAVLPVIASHPMSAAGASTSAATGVAGAKSAPASAGKMPVPSPASSLPATGRKVPANASEMSPGARRTADYLARSPSEPNGTHARTGKPVNADRLPLPWPEPIDCGQYWNENEPICSVEPSFGIDDLIPIGRVRTFSGVRSATAVFHVRSAKCIELGTAKTWGRSDALADHFVRHGTDFNAQTADEYAEMASKFLQESQAARMPTKIGPDGAVRVYDPATNTFASFNPNGTTRTFYKPNPAQHGYPTNLDYWNSQKGLSPWEP